MLCAGCEEELFAYGLQRVVSLSQIRVVCSICGVLRASPSKNKYSKGQLEQALMKFAAGRG